MSERERYERAWRDYKWRLAAFLFAWLGLFIAAPALSNRIGSAWFAVLWFGSCIVTSFRLSMWRCPRCGHCFFWNFIHNQFARRCMHCGLPKWAMTSDAGITAEGSGAPLAAPRAQVTTTGEEVRVTVRAKRNDGIVSFLRIWVVAWAIGEVVVTAVLLTKPMRAFEARFVLVWLIGWTFAGTAAVLALAWMTRGRTTVAAGGGRLSVRKHVGPLGRTRELALGSLRSVRVVDPDTRTLLGTAGAKLGVLGPSVEIVGERSTYTVGPFATQAEAEHAAQAIGDRTSAGVAPGTVTRRWRPSWILPLLAVNTVIGGLMLRWFGAEYAERVASACSVCRPGETPLVCQIPDFVTTGGTVMLLLGGAGVVVLALRRVTKASGTRPA